MSEERGAQDLVGGGIADSINGTTRVNKKNQTPIVTIDGHVPTEFIEFDPLVESEKNTEQRTVGKSFPRSDYLHVNAIALLLKRRRDEKKRAMESFLQFLEVEMKTPAPSRETTASSESETHVPIPLLLSPELHPTHKNYAGSHRLGRCKYGVASLPTKKDNEIKLKEFRSKLTS